MAWRQPKNSRWLWANASPRRTGWVIDDPAPGDRYSMRQTFRQHLFRRRAWDWYLKTAGIEIRSRKHGAEAIQSRQEWGCCHDLQGTPLDKPLGLHDERLQALTQRNMTAAPQQKAEVGTDQNSRAEGTHVAEAKCMSAAADPSAKPSCESSLGQELAKRESGWERKRGPGEHGPVSGPIAGTVSSRPRGRCQIRRCRLRLGSVPYVRRGTTPDHCARRSPVGQGRTGLGQWPAIRFPG